MRQIGKDNVFQSAELIGNRRIDTRVAMPEKVAPPRTDHIKIPFSIDPVKINAFTALNRNRRKGFIILHLRTRVPYVF